MIKTPAEIIESLRERMGEDTSDESLSFLEDVTDTLTDLETRTKDSIDWEQKYKQNDESWRKKYRDRFFSSESDDEEEFRGSSSPDAIIKFEDLFKEE